MPDCPSPLPAWAAPSAPAWAGASAPTACDAPGATRHRGAWPSSAPGERSGCGRRYPPFVASTRRVDGHGQDPRARRSLGGDRPAPATGPSAAEGWTAANPGLRSAHRYPVRAAHGPAVGVPAAGDGLRLGQVLLASPARLAAGGCVGGPAARPARTAGGRGAVGRVARRARRDPDGALRPARSPPPPARQAACRQGLRSRPPPPGVPSAGGSHRASPRAASRAASASTAAY